MNGTYTKSVRCVMLRDGKREERYIDLTRECHLTVTHGGKPLFAVDCSPVEPEELIVGRLLTDGRISAPKEIVEIVFNENGDDIQASVCFESISKNRPDPVAQHIAWTEDMIRILNEYVIRDAAEHRGSHGTHSCTLMSEGKIVCYKEDIGRHNAIDRAIGYAAMHGIDLRGCVAFFSGRVSSEAVRKFAEARIVVLCGKAFPTTRAVELAHENKIDLLRYSAKDGLILF